MTGQAEDVGNVIDEARQHDQPPRRRRLAGTAVSERRLAIGNGAIEREVAITDLVQAQRVRSDVVEIVDIDRITQIRHGGRDLPAG